MYVEIYADVIFLINLIMDYFIFWIVNQLAKKKIKYYRLFFGAFIAAILYCVMIFLPFLKAQMNIFFAAVILMLGTMVAFKPDNIREFIKLILLAHISAFAVGGLGMALFFYTDITLDIGHLIGFTVGNFSIKLLIATTSGSYIVIKLFFAFMAKTLMSKQCFYSVDIFFNGSKTVINALVDTGNTLCEPISNSPVLIAEFGKLADILPDGLKIIFYERRENDLSLFASMSDIAITSRIRMIPFSSLGKENGMLVGFKPDKVIISGYSKVEIKDVIVGIYNNTLSRDGTYEGLLNPSMLAEFDTDTA